MTAQAGKVYRYVRADADKDISGDVFELSLDKTTWQSTSGGVVVYVPTGSLPPRVAAVDEARPPTAGMTGYWYRALTGPGTSFPLDVGSNVVYGRATDNPEVPFFEWTIRVGLYE